MPQTNELRVFISSTFRDLQAEREHLAKQVFPEIRALCRQRGVTFTDIDLRWGITEQEVENEGIIRICLDEVDRCKPFFVGILGHRYGWIPPQSELDLVVSRFPPLADASLHGASITEMEIVHGVLANPTMDGNAFFYFRNPAATPPEFTDTDPELLARLDQLKERIRQSPFPIRENFSSPVEFGQWLQHDLLQVINTLFPEDQAPTPLEVERRAHRAFAASRIRAYVHNPYHLQHFQQWVAGGYVGTTSNAAAPPASIPLFITGESGLGKSSLVACFVDDYRTRNPAALIIEHYVGASATSGSANTIMRHIIEEIRERFSIADEAPASPEGLHKDFPMWLFRAEHHTKLLGIPMLIAIDALNQLNDTEQQLGWLPKTIPQGVHLLLSATPSGSMERLIERPWHRLELLPINTPAVQHQILQRYLGEFHKTISPQQLQRLTADAKATSPLYLRVVAEELRLHGEHETIAQVIDRYASAEDFLQVFDRVLERLERDYGTAPVRHVMSAMWGVQSGLSEAELIEVTQITRLQLSRLLFAVDYHFVRHSGLFAFSHSYFRQAVEVRYLRDSESRFRIHQKLSEYFAGGEQNQRTAREQLWGYWQSNDEKSTVAALCRMDILQLFQAPTAIHEVLTHWARLRNSGYSPGEIYREQLHIQQAENIPDQISALTIVGNILEKLTEWQSGVEVYRTILKIAIEYSLADEIASAQLRLGYLLKLLGENDKALEQLQSAFDFFENQKDLKKLASVCSITGSLHVSRGYYDQAMEYFEKALDIYQATDDPPGIALVTTSMGVVHVNRGNHASAIELFKKALQANEELGLIGATCIVIGNMGAMYGARGNYHEAIHCFQRQIAIAELLGNRDEVASAITNLGLSYNGLGNMTLALEHYERAMSIYKEIGNRHSVAFLYSYIGAANQTLQNYDRALECYQQQFIISDELGEQHGKATATGAIGYYYYDRQEYEQALEFLAKAISAHRTIQFVHGLSYWLCYTAEIIVELTQSSDAMPRYLPLYVPKAHTAHWKPASLRQARALAQESFSISQSLSKSDTLFPSGIILARLDAAEEVADPRSQLLFDLLQQAEHDAIRAELHYWIWKLRQDNGSYHRKEALRLLQVLHDAAPNNDYAKRISELSASAEF